MLDKRKERKIFLDKLKARGMQITTNDEVVVPPARQFKTIYEEILWLLNESPNFLTVTAIADYLGLNYKSVSKAMTKLYRDDKNKTDYLKRIRIDRKRGYKASIPKNLDIPSAFNVIKEIGIRKQNISTLSKIDSIQNTDILSAIKDFLSSGDCELVIRRNSSAQKSINN